MAFKASATLTFRIIIGCVFIYASWDKILHPFVFAANIEAYQILPKRIVYLAAVGVAWTEMVCGVMLITGIWTRTAAFLISGLLLVFILAISRAIFAGLDISCGCFEAGTDGNRIGWPRVIEDMLMLGASGWVFFFPKSPMAVWDGESSN